MFCLKINNRVGRRRVILALSERGRRQIVEIAVDGTVEVLITRRSLKNVKINPMANRLLGP
jgi:hypothetical protein